MRRSKRGVAFRNRRVGNAFREDKFKNKRNANNQLFFRKTCRLKQGDRIENIPEHRF